MLTGLVFEHDLNFMDPCREPRELTQQEPIVVRIAAADLALFDARPACRNFRVEHGSEGARILTFEELARRHREAQARMAQLQEGKRTQYVETMYVRDMALDRRASPIPTNSVPWGQFEGVLEGMGLE